MKLVVYDREQRREIIRERRRTGAYVHDEVWNGVYIVSPLPDTNHNDLTAFLTVLFYQLLDAPRHGRVHSEPNVSDRREGWTKNYRSPDIAVFLPGSVAEDVGTHWVGGPDFLVEVLSRNDRARKKLPFYAELGVREVLIIGRKPWALELYRNQNGIMELVGKAGPDQGEPLASGVFPLTFRLIPADPRPSLLVESTTDARRWLA